MLARTAERSSLLSQGSDKDRTDARFGSSYARTAAEDQAWTTSGTRDKDRTDAQDLAVLLPHGGCSLSDVLREKPVK